MNSVRATRFRIWATETLREFMTKERRYVFVVHTASSLPLGS